MSIFNDSCHASTVMWTWCWQTYNSGICFWNVPFLCWNSYTLLLGYRKTDFQHGKSNHTMASRHHTQMDSLIIIQYVHATSCHSHMPSSALANICCTAVPGEKQLILSRVLVQVIIITIHYDFGDKCLSFSVHDLINHHMGQESIPRVLSWDDMIHPNINLPYHPSVDVLK